MPDPRHYIPHHAKGCVEHNGCASTCPVAAFVRLYWSLYDYAHNAKQPRTATLEAVYGNPRP